MAEFRTCPACGYERGFHVFLEGSEEGTRIGLICPSCGQSYDIGWITGDVGAQRGIAGPVYGGRS